MESFAAQAVATLLISLRIVPTLAFAQPFTLFRIPAVVRVILAIALAAWSVAGAPETVAGNDALGSGLARAAIGELTLGIALALMLQAAFAALLTVGRALDIQAGFGLAALADPTTRNQMPLVGTVFAYAAAALFFATDGPANLIAIWSLSVAIVPPGAAAGATSVPVVIGFLSSAFLVACGIGGGIMLAMVLIDLTLAVMSRTLPQMNVLLLGFQVKTLALLVLLPGTITLAGVLILRLVRMAFDTMTAVAAA